MWSNMATPAVTPVLPSGYRARPATMDDAEGVARVIAACEAAYNLGTQTSAIDIRDDWQDVDLDDETVVVEDASGVIVACADMDHKSYAVLNMYGSVDPEHEGEGLGRYLIEWGERWALERMNRADPEVQVVVRHFVHDSHQAALDLFASCGYRQVRHTYVMGINLDAEPPAPEWPEGVIEAEYRPGIDERSIHEAVEDAFRDTWGRPPSTFERFLAFSRGEGVKPDLWIVARSNDEVAGTCLGSLSSDQGWISSVGVRRSWRRKGLGLALLQAGFRAFWRRGITDVRLSVDAESLTGANRLYERAGMHVVSDYILHEKVLREGIDIGKSPDDD